MKMHMKTSFAKWRQFCAGGIWNYSALLRYKDVQFIARYDKNTKCLYSSCYAYAVITSGISVKFPNGTYSVI